MADQTVTLRITANADGVITGVAVAKKELSGIGDAAESSGKRAEAGMASARRGVISISEQLKNAKQQLVGFFAGFATVQGIRQLAEIADKASNIRAQLQLATNGSAEFARAQSEVYAISQRTSTAMASTAELYARLARSTAEYNVSQQRNLALTETINKTFVVSGTAAQAQANAVTQLTQAFAGGVLRAEEFNSIIENSPRLAQALADGMGIGIGKLRQYVNDGKVSVAEMITALESQSAKIDEEFSRMPLTIERAWTQIGNAVLKYVGDADQATGASRDIAEALSWVADNIAEIIDAAWALGKALAALYTARLLSQAALYTNELAKQAVLHLAAASAAQEMGIKTQAGVAASLKSIGLVNAALGALGAAVAGWQIGTYLREQFIEVELFGIAMVNGLLKAWNHLKAGVALAWEGIKSAAMLAMDAVTEAMARLLRIAASAGNVEVFGKKLFGGTAQEASKLAATLSDLVDPVGDFIAAQSRIAEETRQANAEVDRITGELADYAIENRTAAEAATGAADANGAMKDALNGVPPAADAAAGSVENLYTHLAQVTDVTGDVDAMIRSMARTLADDAVRAQMDYQDNLSAILDLEMQWMALGPLSEEQIAKLNSARAMAGELYRRDMEALNADTVREAERAAEKSTRAWDRFAGSLADAVLDGSQGVKRWWKAMLDNMKAQLIKSGLLRLFGSLFNTGGSGGFSLAGGGAGIGFGSILQLAGSLGGGTGGSLLTGLAGAISSGISGGLMNLGGTLAGLGMGSLGGGLAWAGGSIAANGLLGGLGKSFMTGLGNLFGGGSALMGIGQMIPAIAAIGAVAAAIQKISGGKLFGTKYKFESAQQQFDFTGAGFDGSASMTEVRQRSLFRGRKWRTTALDIDAETKASMEEFWNAILDANSEIARQFGRDAAIDVPASFKQEMDASGKVTAEIGTILGRQYRETWETFAKRISAENIIANIDGILGTTVPAPIFGGGGGGGGPPGRRGDSTIVAGVGNAVIMDVQQQIGEASAIAERWRDSAEALLDGAQFLLLAATDMHTGIGLLGDGSLTNVADLIEDMRHSGESLVDAYTRVSASAAMLDQALELSGASIEGTREHVVRLATAITDAAGGLEQAQALWSGYFQNFYSEAELAARQREQLRTAAGAAFTGANLSLDNFLGAGGMEAFRAQFEAALPTLSAEDIAAWLKAGNALAAVTASARAIDAALDATDWQLYLDGLSESARAVAELNRHYDDLRADMEAQGATAEQLARMEAQRAEALDRLAEAQQAQLDDLLGGIAFDAALAGMTELDAELARIAQTFDGYIAQAMALGATEEQLAQIRAAGAEAAQRAQEAEAQRLAEALADYTAMAQGLRDELDAAGMSEFALAMREIQRWTTDTTESLTDAARAAGMQAAREEDLALVHQVAAQRAAAAIAQLRAQAAALVGELFGPVAGSLDDINAQIAALESAAGQIETGAASAEQAVDNLFERWMSGVESVQQYLDSMLLGDLSALTPAEQMTEARRQLEAAQAAALGGDADALANLPQMADAYLRLVRQYEASGQDYNDQFYWVRELLQQAAGMPAPGSSAAPGGGGGGGGVYIAPSPELEALYAQRDALLAEQEAAHRLELMDQLGQMVRELIQATGEPLADVAASIGLNLTDLTAELGINLSNMTAETALSLVGLARSLGVDVAELAQNVGVSLGDLADRQSLLNQALDQTLLQVPDSIREQLLAPLDAIRSATTEADANAALAQLELATDGLPAGIRDMLAPYFANIDPVPITTELTRLSDIAGTAQAQLAAQQQANDLLQRVADNLRESNVAAGLPAFASGGWVNGPTTLLAGEAGRELILPNPVSEFFQRAGIPINAGGDSGEVVTELRQVNARLERLERAANAGAEKVAGAVVKTGETSDRANDQSRTRLARDRRGATA